MKYIPKTDKQIKELALDIWEGRVFCDRHIKGFKDRDINTVAMVFTPLALFTDAQLKDFLANDPSMIYQYTSQAGPKSPMNVPVFRSFRFLNSHDTKLVMAEFNRLVERLGEGGTLALFEKPQDHELNSAVALATETPP